jgi:hypothetical protein
MSGDSLGYGDDEETTEVLFGPDPDNANNDPGNKFITTYFRHTFSANPPDYVNTLLRVLYDDGVIVYVNGIEVFRGNLPDGDVDYLTTAEGTVDGDDETINFAGLEIDPALFVAGENVLAVEVHQVEVDSTDMGMDLDLTANFEPAPPSIAITSPTEGQIIAPDASGAILITAEATDPDGTVELVEFFQSVTKVAEVDSEPFEATWEDAEEGDYTLTAVAIDASGLRATATVNVTVAAPRPVLIPRGDVWRYDDTGTDLGDAWRGPAFDDSNWASAGAELGYGDGDEAALLGFGPDEDNKYTTYYFRKTFLLADPIGYESLLLNLKADDGYVAYVNGVEVARGNLPSGPISYDTLAPAADEYDFVASVVPDIVLVPGENSIAVEVHQGEVDSSDLSFDLELLGNLAP